MAFQRNIQPEEEIILRRAAREIKSGMVVNLGIGLPTFMPKYLPKESEVIFHSENGFVGMGPPPLEGGTPDNDIVDAGGTACTILKGGACFDSILSFAIIRGGHLDMAILGAFEVSLYGDLANWKIPGKLTPGMGGAMELAQKANHLLVVSHHFNKMGKSKLVQTCTLPVTAPNCVDTLVTERAVFRKRNGKLALVSIHPAHTRETALHDMADLVEVVEPLENWLLF